MQERDKSFLNHRSVLRGRKRFPAKVAQTTAAMKKQSYEFWLHKTAEPYAVVCLLLFLFIKACSNTFWHAEEQTFL